MERFPRSLIEFQDTYRDEDACIRYLVERRWPNGFVCPACGSMKAWQLNGRPVWECRECGRQTSLTAGTLMAKTKLALRVWFWAAYLMTTHSNGLSALQLTNQLGLNYRTAWLLEAKLRRAMVNPERALLSGLVEIDQAEIPFRQKNSPNDVGGHDGMITVVGAVEVVDRKTGATPRWKPGRKLLNTRPQRVRLQVISNNTATTLEAFVRETVATGTVVLTDRHGGYSGLKAMGYRHYPYLVGPMAAHVVLPWIHRVFTLLKRWGLGVYHGVRRKHVQEYLDEYTFRFNRRKWRKVSFEKILGLTAIYGPIHFHEITGGKPRNTSAEQVRKNAMLTATGKTLPPRKQPNRRASGKLDVVVT
jgi:transposase-like protein/Zn ribbon nucleic-acid-binding protein